VGLIIDPSNDPAITDVTRGFRIKWTTPTVVERFEAPCGGETQLFDINDLGMMVGSCVIHVSDEVGEGHSYITDGVTWTPIKVPGSTWTAAYRLNNGGTVVGWYGAADGTEHGFLARPAGRP
jgi:uncharacterized membrane protein